MADKVVVEDSKTEGKEIEKAAELNNTDHKDENKGQGTKKQKEEESEDGSSGGEELLGLLDKPVVVEGKRERKTTDFLFTQIISEKKEIKPLVFEGKGQSLGSIENVNHIIGKTTAVELKPLHRLLYGREGKPTEVKKNIRNFNGFPFEKDTKQFELKQQIVERFTIASLRRLCEIFDLEKKGKRDELMGQLMDFLMLPKSSGKPLPTPKQKKKNKRKKKRKSKSKEGESTQRKRTPSKKEEIVDDSDKEEKTEEDKDDDEDDVDKKEPPKKKRKTEKAETPKVKTPASKTKGKDKDMSKEKTSEKKKTPKKKEPVAVKITSAKKDSPKKKPAKVKRPPVDDDSSSDEEPLAKKAKKQPPTDSELEKAVKGILDGADLQQVTMKSVCKQVYDMFPGFDLTSRKDFIKETVKKVIS